MKSKNGLIAELFLLFAVFGGLVQAAETLPVVPAVTQWKPADGRMSIDLKKWAWVLKSGTTHQLKPLISALKEDLPAVVFSESNSSAENTVSLRLKKERHANPEGYSIEILSDRVKIEASTSAGLYYATRTLLQLWMASGEKSLPMGIIVDAPKYGERGMLIDVGRKFASVETIKDWLRLMGWFKINTFHFHLNDNAKGYYPGYRLESKKFPGLSSKDGFYTWKQIRELQDFAEARGITILPEIDAPGHSLAFTAYRPKLAQPELNRGGFGLAYLDVENPEAVKFMEELLDEVVPHFDSKEIHIGTDEYRIGLIRDKAKRLKAAEGFRKWINHFARYLAKKHGKKTRIWSGYEHLPGTTQPDKNITIDMWETSDAKAKSASGYHFVNSSHFFTYIVPGAPYYGVNNKRIYERWTPLIFANKKGAILDDGDPGLLGGKFHIWNDFGPTGYSWNEIARLAAPSMATFSEKFWGTKGSANYVAFKPRADLALKNVPVVTMLTRNAQPKEGALVWEFKGDKECIVNTFVETQLKNKNLEWPWTASFTITRKHDLTGDEVLMGSDLATLYLDLTHTYMKRAPRPKKGQKRKPPTKVVDRGVGCVRANQAPGYDPITSFNPDIIVFNYKVPLNKKVTLTFVGEERKTTLYVDGKKVQTIRKQMLCPLGRVGAQKLPNGFHGTIHHIKILAEAVK